MRGGERKGNWETEQMERQTESGGRREAEVREREKECERCGMERGRRKEKREEEDRDG